MEGGRLDSDFEKMAREHVLATAEICFYMPDHPNLLQLFFWQTYDLRPKYPRIREFLGFWEEKIEAQIHSVRVTDSPIMQPREFRKVDGEYPWRN